MLIETITTQNLLKLENPYVVKHRGVVIDFNCSQAFLFGETMKRIRKLKRKINAKYCECGCGQEIKFDKNYIRGHHCYRRKLPEETKRKIGIANSITQKGKKLSDETKKKMSIAKQNMSDETKRKIGLGNKNKKVSDETRKKMSVAATGRKHSEEHIKNSAIAHMKCRTDGYCDAWSDNDYKNDIRKDYCENKDCNGNSEIMNLHHINLEPLDCRPANFITFCVGCHTLLHRKLQIINNNIKTEKDDFIIFTEAAKIVYIHKETQKQITIKRKETEVGK